MKYLRLLCGVSLLLVAVPVLAQWDVPDLEESTAVMATAGTLSLFCLPSGAGDPFADAYLEGGTTGVPVQADARITLTLRAGDGTVWPGFPAEDMWLKWTDSSGLQVCAGGTIAHSNTDAWGTTAWIHPILLGGSSQSLVQVTIFGDPLTSSAGLRLHVNSADIDHDGDVDLADVGMFATDFANPDVPYRSDFVRDGMMNVADVAKLASGIGASCP